MTIAALIRDDLEARIASGTGVPEAWTLASLAARYGVSFTPVRAALGELVQRGVLLRETGGRLRVNPAVLGSAPDRSVGAAPLVGPDWFGCLRDLVLRTSLAGEAVFLREEATAEQLGVSRTIVRGVFGRLLASGLLEHVPRRGWRVVPFRSDDVLAYLEVRETLELKALDLARPHLDRTELQRMLEDNQPGPGPRLDNRLHGYFIDRSGNRYLRDFFRTHGGYYSALFDYAALGADVVVEMAAQHRDILSHVLAERWDEARSALAGHIRAQWPVLRKLLARLAE